jgi:hypothetical protein
MKPIAIWLAATALAASAHAQPVVYSHFYRGTFTLTFTLMAPEPGCVPNPLPIEYRTTVPGWIQIVTDQPLESAGSIRGIVDDIAPGMITWPAIQCGTTHVPESTQATPLGISGSLTGTSDGRSFSFTLYPGVSGPTATPLLTGTIAGSGTAAVITIDAAWTETTVDGYLVNARWNATLTPYSPYEVPVCAYFLDPTSQVVGPGAYNGTVNVAAPPGCVWTATSNAGWITVTSGVVGYTSGAVSYTVAANPSPFPRTGTLTIAGQVFTVTQAGAGGGGCAFTLDPTSRAVSATGGSGSFNVTALAGCPWTAASNNPGWITITSGASGTGSGSVRYSAGANTGAARSGTVTAGGRTFTILQSAAAGPQPVSVDPSAGVSGSSVYTFTFSDAAGWQSLGVVNVLINGALNGAGACYAAVVPSSAGAGSMYLVDDAGNAAGPYQGMTLPGSGSVQNSQCGINGLGSSIAGSGNTLTVTLAVTFKAAFAGNKVIYMAARETGGANSGWRALGTVAVPGGASTGPGVTSVAPASGGGFSQSYTFTFRGAAIWQDITVANVLIASAVDGRNACYVAFVPPGSVYLVDNTGNAGGPYAGMVLPGSGSVSNSQCTVSAAGSSVATSGNALVLTLAVAFTPSFAGNKVIYAAARSATQNSGWQAVGTAAVQ